MRFYDYKAQSITSEVHGSIEAKDKKTAAKILNVQGLKVIKIVQQKRFSEKIFWVFIRQLMILTNQNMVLADSIYVMTKQKNHTISSLANRVKIELESGKEFNLILTEVFPTVAKYTIGILRIGSKKRGLNHAISAVLSLKEMEDGLKQEINKAMAYPAFVTFFAVIALIVIFDMVLPEFANLSNPNTTNNIQKIILASAGKGYSSFIKLFWTAILFMTFIELGKRSNMFKELIYRMFVNLPIISKISKMQSSGEFVNSLSLALELNCDISEGVNLAASSVKHYLHKKKLLLVTHELKNGHSLSTALDQTSLFSKLDIASIQIAENSHSLKQTMKVLASENVKRRLKNLNLITQIISPVAILLLGAVIFVVAYTIITPMLMMQNTIG
jgi:type II secretory pathway component PulF